MMDPKNYSVTETLKNGLQVTIRAIRPDDRDAFLDAFKELDDGSVYLRFFYQKKIISDKELTEAIEVDFVRTVALVVCTQEKGEEKIIGGGRYIVFGEADPADKAEVAFTVIQDYQSLGMAGMMLKHLVTIGKEMGIKEFHAEVLSDNTAMLAVFKRSGLAMKQKTESGVAHVVLSLV
jgi:RimJ/RimL family protein N-acetyltransferase